MLITVERIEDLQSAVDRAWRGDRIVLRPGVYQLEEPLVITGSRSRIIISGSHFEPRGRP